MPLLADLDADELWLHVLNVDKREQRAHKRLVAEIKFWGDHDGDIALPLECGLAHAEMLVKLAVDYVFDSGELLRAGDEVCRRINVLATGFTRVSHLAELALSRAHAAAAARQATCLRLLPIYRGRVERAKGLLTQVAASPFG